MSYISSNAPFAVKMSDIPRLRVITYIVHTGSDAEVRGHHVRAASPAQFPHRVCRGVFRRVCVCRGERAVNWKLFRASNREGLDVISIVLKNMSSSVIVMIAHFLYVSIDV